MKTDLQLRADYRAERQQLLEEGEKLYGQSSCWNDGPSQYAYDVIRRHPMYDLWEAADQRLRKIDDDAYELYCKTSPPDAGRDVSYYIGHRLAFECDTRAFKILMQMKQEGKI